MSGDVKHGFGIWVNFLQGGLVNTRRACYQRGDQLYMPHSEILGPWFFYPFQDLLPAIGEQWYIEMRFRQFSIHNIYVTMYDKFVRTIFYCIVDLKSRGEGPKKYENYRTNVKLLCKTFFPGLKNNNIMRCSFDNFPYMVRYICYV